MHLAHGMKVADFGTGNGAYAFALSHAVGPQGHVYAFDVQKDLLTKLKNEAQAKRIRNIEVLWTDLDHPGGGKLSEGTVDAVVVTNTLFQSEHKQNFLTSAKYILRPGGELLLIDWVDSFAGMGPHKSQLLPEPQAKTLLEQAGFMHKNSFFAGSHHYGLLYIKP